MMKTLNKKAFTTIEIMVVIVLLGIMTGFAVLFHQTSQVRADVTAQSANFVSYLRLAQSKAMAGESNTNHGIHVESSQYTVFEGASYNPSATTNRDYTLPGTITINNISLNGGGNDIIFTSPKGETTTYGSLDFTSGAIDKTYTITISSIGTISY